MTDPRYDPRFQRGWNGEPPPPPGVIEPAPQAPPVSSPVPSTPPSAVDRGGPLVPSSPDPHVEGASAQPVPEPDAPPVRNPFRIALVVLGGVLIVAAAGMLWQLTRPISSADQTAFVGPQVEGEVAPWILLAGILCMITAIAVGAVRRG